jgi:hypothetical protein
MRTIDQRAAGGMAGRAARNNPAERGNRMSFLTITMHHPNVTKGGYQETAFINTKHIALIASQYGDDGGSVLYLTTPRPMAPKHPAEETDTYCQATDFLGEVFARESPQELMRQLEGWE